MTSFANKAKLGGQSLLNLKDHPFAPFQKQLIEFTELMDKLQVKLEDAKYVILIVKLYLYRGKHSSTLVYHLLQDIGA